MLLVLDDLHWVDQPTLLLLCHLLRASPSAPLMVLGTYRDIEVDRTDALARTIADLRRDGQAEQRPLDGLSDAEVAGLIAAFKVDDAPAALTRSVSHDTEGNPFFIGEVLRHFVENDALRREGGRWLFAPHADTVDVPETVRGVLDRRISRLPPDAMRLLRLAAVIGRDFDLDLLARVADVPDEDALDQLEQALAARVVTEDPGQFGRYSFTHALIRQALYSDISATRRAMQHRQVARALEELAGDDDQHLMAIAHHFLVGAPAGDVDKAVLYARRAGHAAMQALAYEEAVVLFEQGLAVVVDADERGELLLGLSEARNACGEVAKAREITCEVLELARTRGDDELLGRAALRFATAGPVGFGAEWGVVDRPVVEVLEEALDVISPDDSPLRVQLLSRLAAALYFSHDLARLERAERRGARHGPSHG